MVDQITTVPKGKIGARVGGKRLWHFQGVHHDMRALPEFARLTSLPSGPAARKEQVRAGLAGAALSLLRESC
jgi:hypothetical protein